MPKGKKAIFDFTKYKDVEADYLTVNEWCEDDECADDERLELVDAISRLTLPERRILLTYAECGTYAETAKIFSVNAKTVKNYIEKLREKIYSLKK